MLGKIWLTSSYSGIGTCEHVLSRLAAFFNGGIGMDSHFGCFRFWSAHEIDSKCQQMLMSSQVKPMHLFGSIEEQCDTEVLEKLQFVVATMRQRAAALKAASGKKASARNVPKVKDELEAMSQRCMQKLFAEVRAACAQNKMRAEGWCFICKKFCPYFPPMGTNDARLEVGGNPCVAFSPQGARDRWLHDTAVAASIWFIRTAFTKADFVLQECSHLFPTATVFEQAFPPKDGWSTSVLAISPTDVGAPFKRPRNFSWTTGRRFEVMIPCNAENFLSLCAREVASTGHDFFRAPQRLVEAELQCLAVQRNIQPVNVDSPDFAVSCLPAGVRSRLLDYEKALADALKQDGAKPAKQPTEPVWDLSQNLCVRGKFSELMPSVLCGSFVWSAAHRREMLMQEFSLSSFVIKPC